MRIENIIKEEMAIMVPIICKDLGIEIPSIAFNCEAECIGQASFQIRRNMFGQTVDILPNNSVEINPLSVLRNAKRLFPPFMGDISQRYIARYAIAHELRHVWQTHYNKELLYKETSSVFLWVGGAGCKPSELDADEYALSLAADQEERMAFELLVALHKANGDTFALPDPTIIKAMAYFHKKYFFKPAVKIAAAAACVLGGIYLIKKIVKGVK